MSHYFCWLFSGQGVPKRFVPPKPPTSPSFLWQSCKPPKLLPDAAVQRRQRTVPGGWWWGGVCVTAAVPVFSVCTRRSRIFAIMVGLLCCQIAKIRCHLFLRNWAPQWYLSHSKRENHEHGGSVSALARLKGDIVADMWCEAKNPMGFSHILPQPWLLYASGSSPLKESKRKIS